MALDEDQSLLGTQNPARNIPLAHRCYNLAGLEQQDTPGMYVGDIATGVVGLNYLFRKVQSGITEIREVISAGYWMFGERTIPSDSPSD